MKFIYAILMLPLGKHFSVSSVFNFELATKDLRLISILFKFVLSIISDLNSPPVLIGCLLVFNHKITFFNFVISNLENIKLKDK